MRRRIKSNFYRIQDSHAWIVSDCAKRMPRIGDGFNKGEMCALREEKRKCKIDYGRGTRYTQ